MPTTDNVTRAANLTDDQLCREIRENLHQIKKADRHNRDAYDDNLKMLSGDQWDDLEAKKRREKRLMLTADQLNAPVDQVVDSIRQNRPGPKVSPEGAGTDKYDADIMEGILRRIDYDNNAWESFEVMADCATAGNFGCIEVSLDWDNDRSFNKKVVVEAIPNANDCVYFDPHAVRRDRSDSEWACRVYFYTPAAYVREFGPVSNLKSTDYAYIRNFFSTVFDKTLAGWMNEDTIQVAKYWRVEYEEDTLTLYSNGVAYWGSEKEVIPTQSTDGPVTPVRQGGKLVQRRLQHKKVKWYVTNGREILHRGDWAGSWIPLFPCYGKERWIKGKRVLIGLIQLAKGAQKAFNYAFTSACEVLATTTKSPYIGLLGQFRSKYSQWTTANQEIPAFLEYDPVDLGNGEYHVSPPQRGVQEPPIQSFLQFCQLCATAIQRSTSIFDATLGRQKSEESGKAIQELQEQSLGGNFHWSSYLVTALTHYYRAIADIVQQEYTGAQVTRILRADGTPEEVQINKDFPQTQANGTETTRHYRIHRGNFAFTVEVGPSEPTQRKEAAAKVASIIKVLPPELVAQAADLIAKLADLGPLGDEIANRWIPAQYRDQNDPQAATQKLAQAMQENQVLQQTLQKLLDTVKMKRIEADVKTKVAEITALGGIKQAEIKAAVEDGERLSGVLETALNLDADAQESHRTKLHDIMMHGLDHASNLDQASHEAELEPESTNEGEGQ